MIDFEIFDDGIKSISDFGKDDLMPHFVYCGYHYYFGRVEKLEEMILAKMRKYGIQSSILTMLVMGRRYLVTQEKVKKVYKGELKNEEMWKDNYGSINDDLERFLTNLQNKNEIENEKVSSFFLPKLTNKELKLVQDGNEEHLETYEDFNLHGENPDVDVKEMSESDSKSKYANVSCRRLSIPLTTLETIESEEETRDELQHDQIPMSNKRRKIIS